MVKFLDLSKQYQELKNEIDAAIAEVIEQSAFIGGPFVANFETEFSSYLGSQHCVGVGNGTDALEIALESLGLPPGSEVLVPANSFVASSEAVTRAGHRVVFCDCREGDLTIDLADAEKRINDQTRAVIAVHLYGQPCDIEALQCFADQHGLKIIEDCAQAHGAEWKGRRVGTFGDLGCFSFYPGKNLGAYGDGGAIVTASEALAERCRMIANHGRTDKYLHRFEGRNSRLDGLQAAVLGVKLKYLDHWVEARNRCADYYQRGLGDIADLQLPSRSNSVRHAYHLFVVRCAQRDALMDCLSQRQIQSGLHYPVALPDLEAYQYLGATGYRASRIASTLLSLPIGEHLQERELAEVVRAVRDFFV